MTDDEKHEEELHRARLVHRIQVARRKKRIRDEVQYRLDGLLTTVANQFNLCGNGPKNNWSILFANLWFTDCPCCLFYRGVAFGIVLAVGLLAAAWLVAYYEVVTWVAVAVAISFLAAGLVLVGRGVFRYLSRSRAAAPK